MVRDVDEERNMHLTSSDGLQQGDINHPSLVLTLMEPVVSANRTRRLGDKGPRLPK